MEIPPGVLVAAHDSPDGTTNASDNTRGILSMSINPLDPCSNLLYLSGCVRGELSLFLLLDNRIESFPEGLFVLVKFRLSVIIQELMTSCLLYYSFIKFLLTV